MDYGKPGDPSGCYFPSEWRSPGAKIGHENREAARVYMEGKRWPDGAVCPACSEAKRITTRKGGYYRCNACKTDFTVRTGTIFERSHISLHKWVYAMYLLVTARKGISSLQLAKQIGVTQKSAWFMLQRLREACGNDPRFAATGPRLTYKDLIA